MKIPLLALSFLFLVHVQVHAQEATLPRAPAGKYMGMFEIGYLYQNNKEDLSYRANSSPTLSFFNGYTLHHRLCVGVTVGADFYNQLLVTPVALGIRGSLLPTRVSPFYSLDAGYGSALLSDEPEGGKHEGGWMYNPAVGLRVASGNNTAFTISLGYKQQKAATTETFGWTNNTVLHELSLRRMSIRLGVMF